MARRNYLIEGVSGTGKSSVCNELSRRGYKTVNGDKELGYNGNPETGEETDAHGHKTWIWHVDRVKQLVANKDDEILFFCGGSRNFDKFIDSFDKVFILDVDDKTIIKRLSTRKGNEWGKSKSELELILKLNQTKEDLPIKGIHVDATKPIGKVVDDILTAIRA